MDYRILGPLEVIDGDRTVVLGADRQRAVLGLLLLRRNEVVASEHLIDELWGERPPRTAGKILQNYISQLRRALSANGGGTPLETHGRGYRLEVEPGALDLDRFERYVESGREALATGDPAAGAALFRAGLGLWRGPPLPELAGMAEARVEIDRILERRMAAFEGRVEADLECGRHGELIGELEAAVAREPLREHLRAQLMLALYRSGRQAEALSVYRDGRRMLAEELGIDPGPSLTRLERAILEHEPALSPPAREPRRPARGGRRRPAIVLAAGATLLLAIAAVVALDPGGGGHAGAGHATVPPNSVTALDAATGRVVSRTPVGENPVSVAAGSGAVWVLNGDDRTVSRIDAATGLETRTFAIGAVPTSVAVGAGSVWIGAGSTQSDPRLVLGPGNLSARSVTRIDGATGLPEARITLPRHGDPKAFAERAQSQVVVGEGAVWAVAPDGSVARIDPATNRARILTHAVDASSLAVGGGSVWALGPVPYRAATIWQLDPRSGAVVRRIDVPADGLVALAYGAGSLWATDDSRGKVWRIDAGRPGMRTTMQTVAAAPGVSGIAFEPSGVWVTNVLDDTVSHVDPATNRVRRVVHLRGAPRDVAVGGGRVWVTLAGSGGVAATAARSRPHPGVHGAACRPVVFPGPGPPDALVVSDLPLQGAPRGDALAMSQAIALTFKRHGFRAGRFTVGYQSCDDATAEANGSDRLRCRRNARAYAAETRVVGIVGPYDSPCTDMEIAVANRARGGPLAMVSPSATYPGFTRAGLGSDRADPGQRSPTGERSFARVIPPDDTHGAAAAVLARDLGLHRIFVVDDGQQYGAWLSAVFRRAAHRLHLGLAGHARWAGGRPAARLLRHARQAKPDGVFISLQAFDPNGGRLVRALRFALGRGVVLIGTDGLKPVGLLRTGAGRAAEGVYLPTYLVTGSKLGESGREFLGEIERTRPGAALPYWGLYAAQATEVLLAAIARSDGTRATFTRELFATRLADGPLGPAAIDPNGDVTPAAVAVYRVDRQGTGGDPLLPPELQGASIDRVIAPSPALLRDALENDQVGTAVRGRRPLTPPDS